MTNSYKVTMPILNVEDIYHGDDGDDEDADDANGRHEGDHVDNDDERASSI